LSFQPGDLSPGVVTDNHELHTTIDFLLTFSRKDGIT